MNSVIDDLLGLIENIKTKLTDNEYKQLIDSLAEVNKSQNVIDRGVMKDLLLLFPKAYEDEIGDMTLSLKKFNITAYVKTGVVDITGKLISGTYDFDELESVFSSVDLIYFIRTYMTDSNMDSMYITEY